MMYQLTMQEVTYQDYPIQYFSSSSTEIKQIDITDIWDSVLSKWIIERPNRPVYHSLLSLLEIDLSSIWPQFEVKTETSLFKEISEKEIPEDIVEFDIVVRMLPVKERTIWVKVKSVEKATPRIVEPEGS